MVDWVRRILLTLGLPAFQLPIKKRQVPVEPESHLAEEHQVPVESDPCGLLAPLTIEEQVRAMEMVAREFPQINDQCKYYSYKADPKCPQCGMPLRAAQAQQCFHCGLDWHGRPRPEARCNPVQIHDENNGPRALFDFLVRESWDQAEWTVRRSRWTEEKAWEHAGVAPEEIQTLKQLISSSLQNSNDQIIDIRRLSIHELEITTGWLGGPLAGAGCLWKVRRNGDHWVVTAKGGWVS
jgi:hypothetical protein